MRAIEDETGKKLRNRLNIQQEFLCTKVKMLALSCLSWPISLCVYLMQYLVQPVLQSCFGNMAKEGNEVEYSKYGTEEVDVHNLNSKAFLTNGVCLDNRLVKAGITDGLCTIEGDPTTEMIDLYSRYASGGYAMLISPDVSVDRRCRLPGTTGHTPIFDVHSDKSVYSQLASVMKNQGLGILQLTHPGPIVPFADPAYAPYDVIADSPRSGLSQRAHCLTDKEIDQIFGLFLASAYQAEQCGFSGVQLVASTGYLPSLFLSACKSRSTGKWAGDIFVTKLIEQLIKQRKNPNFIIGIKVNSADLQSGGMSADEAATLVERIAALNTDFIEIGGGNCEQLITNPSCNKTVNENSTSIRETFFLDFATRVFAAKHQVPILAVGDWRNTKAMDQAAKKHPRLLVGLGRPTCLDPDVGRKVLTGSISQIPDWFKEYMPRFVAEKLAGNKLEDKKMAYGVEMAWHALAVGSMAFGAHIPRVRGIFDASQNALAVKIHMTVRAVLPKKWLSSYFKKHPFVSQELSSTCKRS